MKTLYLFLILTIGLLSSYADEIKQKDIKEVKAAIEHNLKAMNDENIDEYLKDIHPDAPSFNNTKLMLERIFKDYDLNVELLSMKVLSVDESYLIIRSKQQTVKIAGDKPFQDNV